MANFGGSWLSEFERIALEKGWNISKEARFKGELASQMQIAMNSIAKFFKGFDSSVASIKLRPDGDFGPNSMNAFNVIRKAVGSPEFMRLYGRDRKYHEMLSKLNAADGNPELWNDGLTDLGELLTTSPSLRDRYVKLYQKMHEGVGDELPTPAVKEEKPFVQDTMPPIPNVEVGGEAKEHIFDPKRSSAVIHSLVSLANDLDEMGAEAAALAVDQHMRNYKKAEDSLYDVHGETGEDLINMAHPGGGPTLVPASDEGGKVETVVEEHKKLVDKVSKQPTGKVATAADKPPKKYRETGATSKSDYADPDNFKYPIHTEKNVRAALSYFSKPKNYNEYSAGERSKIWSRIKSAAKKYKIELDPDNDPPWGKKSKKSYTETLQKLVKKANELEDSGQVEAAQAVDRAIRELQKVVLPFVSRSSAIEAAGSEDVKASVKLAEENWQTVWNNFSQNVKKISKSVGDASVWPLSLYPNIKLVKQFYPSLDKMVSKVDNAVSSGKLDLLGVQKYLPQIEAKLGVIDETTLKAIKELWGAPNDKTRNGLKASEDIAAHKSVISNFQKLMQMGNQATARSVGGEKEGGENLKKYHGTLATLKKILRDNKEFVRVFLGNPKLTGEARLRDGHKHVQTLVNWINGEGKKHYSDDDAWMANRELWNKIVKPLRSGIENKNQPVAQHQAPDNPTKPAPQSMPMTASSEGTIVKTAKVPFAVNPGGGISGVGRRAPGARRPSGARRREDQNVKALQQAMVNAGISLEAVKGRNPIDGQWGSRTHKAYNELRRQLAEISPRIVFPNATDKQAPDPETLQRATNNATTILGKRRASTPDFEVEIAEGKIIPGQAMRTHRKFVGALAGAGIIEKTDDYNQMANQAFEVLRQFINRLKTDGDFRAGYEAYPQKYATLRRALSNLLGQLMPAAKQYRRQQQGTKPKGDLLNPFAEEGKGQQQQPQTTAPQVKLNFNPRDLSSIKQAIQGLRNTDVMTYRAFRDNILGGRGANVRVGYERYYDQLTSLMQALRSFRQIISRQESPKAYRDYEDMLNHYIERLYRNVGSHFRV